MTTERLTGADRRLVTGVVLIAAAFTTVSAAYNYILNPMLDGLGASESQTSLLRQLPSIAVLLVVFLSGVVGDRFGDRRVLKISAVVFTVGAVMVTVAPIFGVAALGLVIQSAAVSSGFVVSLGLMSARIQDRAQRASAFAVLAIVSPLVYMIVPVIAGGLVDNYSWRMVTGVWILAGLVAWWGAHTLLPPDGPPRREGELATPLLAGVVLAAGVQSINTGTAQGWTSPDCLIRVGIAVVGLLVLVALFRRLESPSLSLAALRSGGMLVLLTIVLLVPFANLFYYATMSFQYIFHLSTLETALAMVPVQLAGVAAAVVTRKILQKRGVRFTGTLMLVVFAACLLPVLLVAADSPLLVPIVAFSFYAAAFVGISIPITNAIMNTAPAGEEGSASAFRSAASSIGSALGVVFTTAVVTSAVVGSLNTQFVSQGLDPSQSKDITKGIIDGATSEDLASQYAVPVQQVQSIDADMGVAMVDGLHDVAVSGVVVALVCAGFFYAGMRRQERLAVR